MGAMKLNNSIHSIDRTRTLPYILANDPNTQGAAVAIGEQMSKVASLIRINKIYPRIDELDEATLDILAQDLHVDWYDYTYDLEVKRAVIKNSVRIHMKLGTKYAVETATSDVYSGSTVEEWFEYGSDPYFFRLNIDITSGGITVAQQISLYEKIMFYKNCRSHLDYFNFQVNLETEVSLGGCTFYIRRLEVQPFLETEIDLESIARLGGVAHSKTAIEVQPFLETNIDLEGITELGGITHPKTTIEVQPFLETNIDLETTVETKGATKTGASVEVQPFLETNIDLEAIVETKGATKTGASIEVQPFLETGINLEATMETKGATKTGTSVEVQPFLETGIDLETTMETKGAMKTEASIEVQPFLVKEITIEKAGEVQTGGQTEITQKIKIAERKDEQ